MGGFGWPWTLVYFRTHKKHFICGSKSLVRFTGHPKKRLNDPLTQGLWTQWRICQTHVVGLEKASSFGPVSSRFPIQPRYHPFRLVKSFHIWDTHQASWATSLSQILLWLARWWRYRDRSKLRTLKGCISGPVCRTDMKFCTLVSLLPMNKFASRTHKLRLLRFSAILNLLKNT